MPKTILSNIKFKIFINLKNMLFLVLANAFPTLIFSLNLKDHIKVPSKIVLLKAIFVYFEGVFVLSIETNTFPQNIQNNKK
jgi:hypothetical protein